MWIHHPRNTSRVRWDHSEAAGMGSFCSTVDDGRMCGIVLAAAVGCKSLIDDQDLIDQTFCSVKGAMIFETVPARIIHGGSSRNRVVASRDGRVEP